LLLESWHFAHSCVSCFVGYLEQPCVEVVQSLHFDADFFIVCLTIDGGPEILTFTLFIDLNRLFDVIAERFNQSQGVIVLIIIRRFTSPDECLFEAGSNNYTRVTAV
jgi:mevalonate pyrophosphate decarboxylase